MAHWCIADAGRPNYNKAWVAFDEDNLAQCLKLTHDALDRDDEARIVKQRLDLANARTDVPLRASCFYRMGLPFSDQ